MDAVVQLSKRGHRLLVLNDDLSFAQIIAQSDVLKFLTTRHAFVGSAADRPFLEIGLTPETTIGSLDDDVHVVEAMRYMRDCMISGVAICDKKNGAIKTNFSASDLLASTKAVALLTLPRD
jgi:hypothetical protein